MILSEILGDKPTYSPFTGGVQEAREVRRTDVKSIEPTLAVSYSDAGIALMLGYKVSVSVDGLPWVYTIDGSTGRRIRRAAAFNT